MAMSPQRRRSFSGWQVAGGCGDFIQREWIAGGKILVRAGSEMHAAPQMRDEVAGGDEPRTATALGLDSGKSRTSMAAGHSCDEAGQGSSVIDRKCCS